MRSLRGRVSYFRSVRGTLILALVLVLLAEGIVELSHYRDIVKEQRQHELEANLEVARAVAMGVDSYVEGILLHELAIGLAFMSPGLSTAELNRLLAASAGESHAVRHFGWVSPEGRVAACSDPEMVGLEVGDSSYFQEIRAGREWLVSDLLPARSGAEPTYLIVRGFRDGSGALRGAAVAAIDSQRLGEAIRIQRIAAGSFLLVDQQGRPVYGHPEANAVGEGGNQDSVQAAISLALAGKESTGDFPSASDGKRQLAGVAPVSSIGWAVSASRSEEEAIAPVLAEFRRETWGKLFVAAVMVPAALLIGRNITSPLRRLRQYVSSLETGDLGRRVEAEGATELRGLGDSFNRMAAAVESRTKELETLLDVVRATSDSGDVDAALHGLAARLARAVNVPICHVALLTDDGQSLVSRASYSSFSAGSQANLGASFPIDDVPPARQVLTVQQAVEVPDVESDLLSPAERERWRKVGLQSALGVPLIAGDRAIGLLALGDVRPKRFDEGEKRLCLAVAQQAAVAIERSRLHQTVAEERERLDAIVQSTSDGIVVVDGDRHIISMNPAMEALSGWTIGEVQGRPCWEIFRSRDRNEVSLCETACPMLQAIEAGSPVPYVEAAIATRDGQRRELSVSYAFIRRSSTERSYGVAVCRDITKVREVEKLKEEFVSLISHDLRNPLAVIQGRAQFLERLFTRSNAGNLERSSAAAIVTSAKRMNTMIQDLVDSSRLESGQLSLDVRPLDLRAFLSELFERSVGVMDVGRISVAQPADVPPVLADPDRLERVFINLLSNALKYSSQDSEVVVGGQATAEVVTIAVSDAGAGIAAEDLPHVFERFYRAKGERRTDGLGLGLYITRMLVEAHGGRIWVESELARGSTFYFTLPRS
ncbi:MAG: PAS domain S-box protein [Chloroflexi bacterium]|nr:PAS domain S-box protein [Chloroflexota bacterium]